MDSMFKSRESKTTFVALSHTDSQRIVAVPANSVSSKLTVQSTAMWLARTSLRLAYELGSFTSTKAVLLSSDAIVSTSSMSRMKLWGR